MITRRDLRESTRDILAGSRLFLGDGRSTDAFIDARLEADRIVCFACEIDRATLLSRPDEVVDAPAANRALSLARRRSDGEPIAYLFGSSFFCDLEFTVDDRVLIPRPETETLVDFACERAREIDRPGVLVDWCTGSGCVAIAFAKRCPSWRCLAVDISEDALAVATANAERHGVADRFFPILAATPRDADIAPNIADVITANPPYIPSHEIKDLETQVRDHEPTIALDGGASGLDVIELLISGIAPFMADGARAIFETAGAQQVRAIRDLCERSPLTFERSLRDHLGVERFSVVRR